ncbi:MAG: hypothetical protein GC134_02395 [Proteobacteria bacterium]|nr:hypothetical protein [Pseudomonadota bacterium]
MSMQTPASRRNFFTKLMTSCVRSFEHGHASGVFGEQGYEVTLPEGATHLLCTTERMPIAAGDGLAVAAFKRLPRNWQGCAEHFDGKTVTVLSDKPIRHADGLDRLVILNPPDDYIAPCPVLLVFDARTTDSAAMSLIQIARQPANSDVFFGDMEWYPDAPLVTRIRTFACLKA